MSVYLNMIGREQKDRSVGGGETSDSRGAAGVSQTDRSVLTLLIENSSWMLAWTW